MCIQPPYWMMELYNLISHFLFHFPLIIFHFITNFMPFISFFSFPLIFNFILFCFAWGAPSWGIQRKGEESIPWVEKEKREHISVCIFLEGNPVVWVNLWKISRIVFKKRVATIYWWWWYWIGVMTLQSYFFERTKWEAWLQVRARYSMHRSRS